jgi:hypothetical protein
MHQYAVLGGTIVRLHWMLTGTATGVKVAVTAERASVGTLGGVRVGLVGALVLGVSWRIGRCVGKVECRERQC